MITSMMCSTMTSVMPERWMSRTRSMASWISRWVRPAIASSSSSTFGSVASARAISSRLRPGVPSERAGASASPFIPTRSSTARALASAAWRCGVRRKAPIITFSSTDMRSKVCGTWKVRASPSCARASGVRAVMSWPSKKTFPSVAGRSPVRQLKKVDLPAPFGPIRPRMSPCSKVTLAESTALKLPKAFVMSRASRSMAGPLCWAFFRRLGGAFREQAIDQLKDAAGLEARDQHDDAAIDHKGEACALAAEHAVGDLLQRHQDRRADERAEQQAGAAERGHDQHLHRDQNAEAGLGIDEAEHHGVERAGDAGEAGAEHERVKLGAACGRAQRARGTLGIADRAQVKSHPAVGHPPGDAKRDDEDRQEQIVVRQRRDEGHIEHVTRHGRAGKADGRTEKFDIDDDQARKLRNRDRRHAEIMARQPQRRHANHSGNADGEDNADGNANQRRELEMVIDAHRGIG